MQEREDREWKVSFDKSDEGKWVKLIAYPQIDKVTREEYDMIEDVEEKEAYRVTLQGKIVRVHDQYLDLDVHHKSAPLMISDDEVYKRVYYRHIESACIDSGPVQRKGLSFMGKYKKEDLFQRVWDSLVGRAGSAEEQSDEEKGYEQK